MDAYNKSLSIYLRIYGENDTNVADDYLAIGLIQMLTKEYSNAIESCQKALKICKSIYGEDHNKCKSIIKNIECIKIEAQGGFT